MVDSRTMSSAPVAVVDALNSLLEANQNSIIRFMGDGSPYLSRATVEVRRPLQQMLENNLRRSRELYHLIDVLGGSPRPHGLQPEEQYLAFLSLKFLLPKLVDEKVLILQRYENALRQVPESLPEVRELLLQHQAECTRQLETLKKASEDVIAASKAGKAVGR